MATPRPINALAFFVALLSTAIALGGALAHAFELLNKINLSQSEYFVTQKLYAGWNKLAILLVVEAASMIWIIILHRENSFIRRPVIAALVFLFIAQVVFWVFTFPANQATNNWTVQPENWNALRFQWEYSHLAGAVFQLLAMAALIVAVLRRGGTSTAHELAIRRE